MALSAMLVSVSARAGGSRGGSGGATFEGGVGCDDLDCPEYEAGLG